MRKIIIGSVLAFAISMNLLFVNCSGPHVVGIDLMSGAGEVSLSGTWHSNLCAPLTAGKSARDVFVFQSLNSDVVAIKKGHLEYANTTCSGAGTLVAALSDMGTLEIKNR